MSDRQQTGKGDVQQRPTTNKHPQNGEAADSLRPLTAVEWTVYALRGGIVLSIVYGFVFQPFITVPGARYAPAAWEVVFQLYDLFVYGIVSGSGGGLWAIAAELALSPLANTVTLFLTYALWIVFLLLVGRSIVEMVRGEGPQDSGDVTGERGIYASGYVLAAVLLLLAMPLFGAGLAYQLGAGLRWYAVAWVLSLVASNLSMNYGPNAKDGAHGLLGTGRTIGRKLYDGGLELSSDEVFDYRRWWVGLVFLGLPVAVVTVMVITSGAESIGDRLNTVLNAMLAVGLIGTIYYTIRLR